MRAAFLVHRGWIRYASKQLMSDESKEPEESEEPEAAADTTPPPEAPPEPEEPPPVSAIPPAPESSDPLGMGLFDAPKSTSTGAISSGPFEISRASFSDDLGVSGEDLPPSTVIANAMGRNNKGLPLRAIVGITVGVLVVSVGLALLLFR